MCTSIVTHLHIEIWSYRVHVFFVHNSRTLSSTIR